MLYLKRRKNEIVDLTGPDGKPIGSIEVIQFDRGAVRLGFNMPEEITVMRREVTERMAAELEAAK